MSRKTTSLAALPFFQIITPSSHKTPKTIRKMSGSEIPFKPRRKKKANVPVHKTNKAEEKHCETSHKIYNGQFSSKRRLKQRNFEANEVQTAENAAEFNLDLIESERSSHRISKKDLLSVNERLFEENQQLSERLTENEEYFSKKMNKFREKLNSMQKYNEDVIQENNIIKTQYQDLLINLEQSRVQLEQAKHCRSCEELKKTLEKHTNDSNVLKSEKKQMSEDISMLKNVVYRLNVQMERYQEKLRKYNIQTKPLNINQIAETSNLEVVSTEIISSLPESHLDHPHVSISWGSVNSHTLGPLLDAYQETLYEKEDIIHNYETELSHFTGKLQEIMKENEELHKRLTVDDECSAKLSVELDKVRSDLKSTKEQNDLLIKKCALKQDKLEEVLQCYEQKVEQLRRDYNVVVEQYHKSRAEIAALKEKIKSLIDSQDDFKNERQNYIPVSVHTASVNECKKWYEELKHQYEQEKAKLKESATSLQKQISDLTNSTTSLKSEKEELENKIKVSDKQMKKADGKYLDLQHAFHEMQLSRTACRKQLHKAMNFAKDLVAEQESLLKALHERQQENKVVKQIGTDIATRMDSLKSQLKTVQRDAWNELTTVEERLQEQDTLIYSMKREHAEEVEKLKEIIQQKEKNNLLLKDVGSSNPKPHYLLIRDRNVNK